MNNTIQIPQNFHFNALELMSKSPYWLDLDKKETDISILLYQIQSAIGEKIENETSVCSVTGQTLSEPDQYIIKLNDFMNFIINAWQNSEKELSVTNLEKVNSDLSLILVCMIIPQWIRYETSKEDKGKAKAKEMTPIIGFIMLEALLEISPFQEALAELSKTIRSDISSLNGLMKKFQADLADDANRH